jgi:foldase protein PrsA
LTESGFLERYASTLARLKETYGIEDRDIRAQIEGQLYRDKLLQSFEAEVPRVKEQVHARHILVEDEDTAKEVLKRLEEGDSWDELASEYSMDGSNRDRGGDLGWFPRGVMISAFEEAAFAAPVGVIQGPVESPFGWHLIEVVERGDRPLEEALFQREVQAALSDWLADERQAADLVVYDHWRSRVPAPPEASSSS